MENEQRGMITFILAVCGNVDYVYSFPQSPPSRAAWIEIIYKMELAMEDGKSPPSRAAWIEMPKASAKAEATVSPPSRAAWIEMIMVAPRSEHEKVAAFTGGVD